MPVMNAVQDTGENIVHFSFDGSIAVQKFDMMFHDTNDVKPMSSFVWDTDEATTQSAASPKFAGLAGTAKKTTDGADTAFPVITRITCDVDCASSTFEVGDRVTPAKASGNALENQKVKKTTTSNQYIGTVVRRYGSATTRVRVKFQSNVVGA